jgi:3-ketosteroid 9alpha-monooxygenase subunit A
MTLQGWYQVAYERDLHQVLTPAQVGEVLLVLVSSSAGVRAFQGICPHRGAHLAHGGKLMSNNTILCPFHHFAIGLDDFSVDCFKIRQFSTLVIGGLVFVRIAESYESESYENGLEQLLTKLDESACFIPGFMMELQAPAELVIENAFDSMHFQPVHNIYNNPHLTQLPSEDGEFSASGIFVLPASPWQKTQSPEKTLQIPYRAQAFSPGLVISAMAGNHPYWVITSATPIDSTSCIIRLSIAVPVADHTPPDPHLCQYLLQQCRAGIEKDRLIWENMQFDAPPQTVPEDVLILAFREYCQSFSEAS